MASIDLIRNLMGGADGAATPIEPQTKPADDWGGNLMRQFPYNPYFGKDFEDRIFKTPNAEGTDTLEFDRMAIDPSGLHPDVIANQKLMQAVRKLRNVK